MAATGKPKPKPKTVKTGKVGRPKIEFNAELGKLFGYFKATYATIAEHMGCSYDTVIRQMNDPDSEFASEYKKGFASLKMKLSEAQIQTALAGNATLLIFLGKQYLGQSDNPNDAPKRHEIVGFEFVEVDANNGNDQTED